MRVSLEELIESVREREPDPAYADVPDPVLVESFTREAALIAASTCRWLLMLAEIVRRGVWAEDGMISPAAWLSWRAGMAASTAREHVRVALALADFPMATARFAAGELSYSKVRAIVSTGRPELDELLVRFAACAAGHQLQRICRSFVTADGPTMDPWSARDASLRELPIGMSEIRIQVDAAASLAAQEAYFAQPAIMILSMAGMLLPLGLIILAIGLVRTGVVARWLGAAVLVGPIAIQAGMASGPRMLAFGLPFVVAMGALARETARA
ncbi:MAG: 13E12 repeat family protein [Actinobacteria bacterium]|nr:13E12 repeat family protein [Actinomycetota bacterium]